VSAIQAIILGVIQGIAEFFPISSSAHLKILKSLLSIHLPENFVLFDLTCHLGTTFATILFLRKDLLDIFTKQRKTIFLIALAILPLFPMYFLGKNIREYLSNIHILGLFLIITSILLFITSALQDKPSSPVTKKSIKDFIFIGFMQSLALIPGFSRCGSTVSGACYRGWSIKQAISFSFILSIPTILGGNFLEIMKLFFKKNTNFPNIPLHSYFLGFITSFIVGLLALRLIFSITINKKIRPFAWYCLTLGIFALIYYNI
jgi:undecaprenyl-diphosphatase